MAGWWCWSGGRSGGRSGGGGVEGEVVVCRESGIKGGCRETVALGSDHHVTTQQGSYLLPGPRAQSSPREKKRKKVIPKRASPEFFDSSRNGRRLRWRRGARGRPSSEAS